MNLLKETVSKGKEIMHQMYIKKLFPTLQNVVKMKVHHWMFEWMLLRNVEKKKGKDVECYNVVATMSKAKISYKHRFTSLP